jgi:hypothetical protein
VGPPARTKGKGAALASKTAPEGCPRRCGGNGLRTYPGKICRVYGYRRVNFRRL